MRAQRCVKASCDGRVAGPAVKNQKPGSRVSWRRVGEPPHALQPGFSGLDWVCAEDFRHTAGPVGVGCGVFCGVCCGVGRVTDPGERLCGGRDARGCSRSRSAPLDRESDDFAGPIRAVRGGPPHDERASDAGRLIQGDLAHRVSCWPAVLDVVELRLWSRGLSPSRGAGGLRVSGNWRAQETRSGGVMECVDGVGDAGKMRFAESVLVPHQVRA